MRTAKPLVLLALTALTACAADSDADPVGDPDGQESAWEAQSVDHEESSTHLWIVNRAIDILGRHTFLDAAAAEAVSVLNDATCRRNWQQGLLDADFKAEYNNGLSDMPLNPTDVQVAFAGATWESHFYDPETGKNYKGATSPTAFTESGSHLERAFESRLNEKTGKACYELGLALHYYTDLTQPMHATNFTALDRPAKLHSHLEGYAMKLQERYRLADWSGPVTGSTSDYVHQTAKDAKPLFMAGVSAIVHAYKSYTGWHILTCRNIDADPWRFVERQHLDYEHCWEGDPGVDKVVGDSLKAAQDHTAKYIHLVGQRLVAASAPGGNQ